jgi:hypothetical protein
MPPSRFWAAPFSSMPLSPERSANDPAELPSSVPTAIRSMEAWAPWEMPAASRATAMAVLEKVDLCGDSMISFRWMELKR